MHELLMKSKVEMAGMCLDEILVVEHFGPFTVSTGDFEKKCFLCGIRWNEAEVYMDGEWSKKLTREEYETLNENSFQDFSFYRVKITGKTGDREITVDHLDDDMKIVYTDIYHDDGEVPPHGKKTGLPFPSEFIVPNKFKLKH